MKLTVGSTRSCTDHASQHAGMMGSRRTTTSILFESSPVDDQLRQTEAARSSALTVR